MFSHLKNVFLDILFPAQCLSCKKEGSFLCVACKNSLPLLPPTCFVCHAMTPARDNDGVGRTCLHCRKKTLIHTFLSPFTYRHPLINTLVHEFKYQRIRSLGPISAQLIVSYFTYYRVISPSRAVIVAIPLHPRKERVRGFNQALLIASEVSKRLQIPLEPHCLIRTTWHDPQSALSATLRRENVKNVFEVRNPNRIRGKTILLFDDIKTTGATLEEAARALKKAGARAIWAITLAH
ncbi:MAG: ComF family protein [Candidatus Sungbacteria bacterium]|nr:ComF family protein [bacterium]MDZ4260282.1 ComF family protein [Candidatus Sungbacteria bacterium]